MIADRAILLTQIDHGRQVVAASCEHSASRGVTVGMTVAHAQALLGDASSNVETRQNVKTSKRQNVNKTVEPDVSTFRRFDVSTFPHESRRDAQALAALARWMIRFAPIVSVDPPDGLLLDISGCQRLYPSEERLLDVIVAELGRLGFNARAACAATFGCAWAAARFISPSLSGRGPGGGSSACHVSNLHPPPNPLPQGRGTVIPTGHEREHLAPLPIAALRLEPSTIDALREVGIESIEHLYPIPRRELAARFGLEVISRLDRAMGHANEVADAVRPIEAPRVERCFDGPVKQIEAVMLAMRELVEKIATLLLHREEGVRRLEVFLERIDAEPIDFALRLSRPNRSVRHLWSLLQPRVEVVNLGYGVERIVLRAASTARIRHEQEMGGVGGVEGRHGGTETRRHEGGALLGEFIDAVVARFGADRIFQLHPVESHLPERAARRVAVNSPSLSERTLKRMFSETAPKGPPGGATGGASRTSGERNPWTRDGHLIHPGRVAEVPSAGGRGDRPSLLLNRPEPIEVVAAEGDPISLRCSGKEHRIISASGPERIAEEWWSRSHDDDAEIQDTPSLPPHRDYFQVQDEHGRCLWIFRAGESGRWYMHGAWT